MITVQNLSIQDAHKMLKAGDLSVRDLVDACKKNINEKNEILNVFLTEHNDIHEQIERAQNMFDNGTATTLTGIPFGLKANILREGQNTSAASKILENYKATYSATAVKRLEKEGVVFLGSTNMDEFAFGSSTENSAYGPTVNPHDTKRVAGGTSGGSAAAVASGMCLAALGTDTGGSIRQPSALCGVVGMKSSYGAVPRDGAIASGSSLDQIGPIAKSVDEVEMIMNVISGSNELDMTSIDTTPAGEINTIRVGVIRNGLNQVQEETLKTFNNVVSALQDAGHTVKEHDISALEYSLPVYYITMLAESSTNLARYDGMRYGQRVDSGNLLETYLDSRSKGFGLETKRRIMLGTYILSKGYEDRLYTKSIKMRENMKKEFAKLFGSCDVLVSPTTLGPAFKLGEKTENPVEMYAEDIFTVTPNIIGHPSISIPMGMVTHEDSLLPVGIQLIGMKNKDRDIIQIAKKVEHIISDIL